MIKNDIVLVGKPNAGKSSLFNKLTGLNQKVGNFAGVTVEVKSATYKDRKIIDLPGLKSLLTTSPEEKISKNAILELNQENGIIFIANGAQLEDSLMLFSEIADLQVPMILVVNFKDELIKNKIEVDTEKIQSLIGCPVIFTNSKKGEGIDEIFQAIDNKGFKVPNTIVRSLYDNFDSGTYDNQYRDIVATGDASINREGEYLKRKKTISSIIRSTVINSNAQSYLSQSKKLDKYLLHPIYGILIFLVVMYAVFQAVFSLSAFPMDWIDMGMSSLSELAKSGIPEGWFQDLIADALIPGIGGVVIFIPQIAILFFLLGILEHTGYLSRISFISDAFLRKFGLSGKSVIPLMSSWACAIPAIMSTRVIDDPRERLAVIFASPLMTCSARLPVYTILIAVAFPVENDSIFGIQGLLLLGLYLLGVVSTLVVAYFVNRRIKVEGNPFWSLELPIYRMPNWRNIFLNVYNKTKSFVIEAGKVILAITILLWVASTNSPQSDQYISEQFKIYQEQNQSKNQLTKESFELEYSYTGYIGKAIEPVIEPLGYDWKIGIGLLASFAAREVFVGTMSTIYSIESEEEGQIVERWRNEKVLETGEPRYSMATSISLLLFYVFAMQCMSTLAIVRKETGTWKWAIYQFVAFFILAYVFAFGAYQVLS